MTKGLLFCALCLAPFIRGQEHPRPSVTFRVQSFARENAAITNPIAWVQLLDRVPEGSRVQEEDVVFRLDLEGTKEDIDRLKNRLETEGNNAEKDIAKMEATLQDLRDKRETLLDNRAIQEARLAYFKSIPKKEDISIAEGRWNVARERLEAEKKNLATMQSRLEQNLIAPIQVQQATWTTRIQEARTLYAKQMFALTKRPTPPHEIEKVLLLIDNLNLEIAKVEKEIPTQEIILGIQQESRNRRVENIRKDLAERIEELQFETLKAPRDGVLLYTSQLKRQLTEGSKPSKGMVIGEIPEPSSIAFAGVIPEQVRHLYAVGDPVSLKLNMFPNTPLQGTLMTISPFSRDVLENSEGSTGVKVVDVQVALVDPPAELPIGTYGWATLVAQHPLRGERIPLSWVRYQGGKPYVSIKGTYAPVDGVMQGSSFILTPPHPPSSDLQPEGEWPQETTKVELESGNRFTVSGELLPLESIAVTAPRVRAWDMKISWVHPENQLVVAGEVIARLDSEMIEEQLQGHIEDAQRRTGDRESAEQELEIKRSQRDFQLSSAKNNVQIAKLERYAVIHKDSEKALVKAEMDQRIAEIQLEIAVADRARGERTPELTAPAELERREREVLRRTYSLERANIALESVKEGSSELERRHASLKALRAEESLAQDESRFQRDLSRLESRLQWRIRREQRDKSRVTRSRNQQESMTLTAPVSGLVKYEKIWDGVRTSKIRTGMRVYPRNVLINLSNTSEVYVEVPLPERYVHELETGMDVQVVIPSEGNLQWRGEVTEVGQILEPARQDMRPGSIYANQESTREQVLPVKVVVDSQPGNSLKPGAIAQLIFPFEK